MTDTARRKAIVLCVDAPYLPFALFLISQIAAREPERDYDFCLLSETPLEVPDAFLALAIHTRALGERPEYAALRTSHLARATYLRLWIAEVFCDYDRLLYLDADMFADLGGFGRLMEVDLGGRVIGAVRDMQQWQRPNRHVKEFRIAGLPALPYFNAGLLLIDTARFREEGLLRRCLAIAGARPEAVIHHDQSLLNLALAGNWAELSPVWNWQWPRKRPLYGERIGARLQHFVSGRKPWNDPAADYPRRYAEEYAEFFRRHFPQSDQVRLPPGTGIGHAGAFWRMIVRQALSRRAADRLLAAFPDPWTVRPMPAGDATGAQIAGATGAAPDWL